MTLHELDTPALLVDLDRLEANIAASTALARETGKRLRPHVKTHKCPEIAKLQVASGAVGITVAKTSEAEVFADAGIEDIFIANQVIGAQKLDRLLSLNRRIRLRVGLDSFEGLVQLSDAAQRHAQTVSVLIEVDTFSGRAGVRTAADAVLLGWSAIKAPGIEFAGVFTHEGGVYAPTHTDRQSAVDAAMTKLTEVVTAMRDAGLEVREVSTGSTPGAPLMAQQPMVTEIRPGNGIFFDAMQLLCGAEEDQLALSVLTTVISRPEETVAIIDAGTKTFSGDKAGVGSQHGLVMDDPAVLFDWANEEHGHLNLSKCSLRPKIGDRLRIVPWHACTCCNMLGTLNAVRGENVVAQWPIAARGCVW